MAKNIRCKQVSTLLFRKKTETAAAVPTRRFLALVHSEWRGLFRGLAILVVVGLEGTMVLLVNMPFWLPIFVII